ncbi:hypothetical protein, partial [Salmonella sp. s54412]|uniref:hypothetical protein n=1 Tax=Salmonella sp. s54412 TaxID=3160128 RepID=UPI0037544BBF
DKQTYLMFGDGNQVFLSHMITKALDFQQVVRVIDIPMSDDDDKFMIWYGLKVTFPDLVVD